MPREIDCPDCGGDGFTAEHDPCDPHIDGICTNCPIQVQCSNCKGTLKITVYTEEELQEAIKQEREECALVLENLPEVFNDRDHIIDVCLKAIRSKE